MLGLNVIFHLVSLLALMALLATIAYQRQRLFFMRNFVLALGHRNSQPAYVDWLHRFLKNLSYAVQAPELTSSELALLPKVALRCDLRQWAQLHAVFGVCGFSCIRQQPDVVVGVKLARLSSNDCADLNQLLVSLQSVLPKGVVIRFESA